MAKKVYKAERDIILDSITEGVFTVDREWRITSFNRAAESITKVSRDTALGQPCRQILRANICEGDCVLKQTMRTGRPIIGKAVTIVDAEGTRRPISISTAILTDTNRRTIGGVETFRDLTMIEELRKEIERSYCCEDIISRSHRMRCLFEILPAIAESGSTVLIEGESGTGKELFARAIHHLSPRRKEPFIAVSASALPDTLIESELFGYKAGAFTDAKADRPGRFALADGGTLFLDEIGDISPAFQVRLLRVLEERVYEPLGSVESVKADVRIVAATNKRLTELVRQGRFREDLFYRVNVVNLELPPLRERMEDVPVLAEHFIGRLNRIRGKEVAGLSDDALASLLSYDYPGNVRELENVIERAFVLCRSGRIEPKHLPEFFFGTAKTLGPGQKGSASLKQIEATFLMDTLRRNDWNRAQTARQLGIHKATLHRKIRRLGLRLPNSLKDRPR